MARQRKYVFQLQLRNKIAYGLIRLFQSLYHRTRFGADCKTGRRGKSEDDPQSDVKKALKRAEKRLLELDKLLEAAFEEKVAGKIPESVCVKRIEKYTAEQTELQEKTTSLIQGLEQVSQVKTNVDKFIRRLKLYFDFPALTREMCLALLID